MMQKSLMETSSSTDKLPALHSHQRRFYSAESTVRNSSPLLYTTYISSLFSWEQGFDFTFTFENLIYVYKIDFYSAPLFPVCPLPQLC